MAIRQGQDIKSKKRRSVINLYILTGAFFFSLGLFISAGLPVIASPGDSSDPLVSVSWVDHYIDSAFDQLGQEIDDLYLQIKDMQDPNHVVLYIGDATALINDSEVVLDVAPCLINNYTMLPLRFVGEALHLDVDWDNNSKTVTCSAGNKKVILPVGSGKATVNGESITLNAPPVIKGGRVLVPARFIAEAFSCRVDWDGKEKRVDIY